MLRSICSDAATSKFKTHKRSPDAMPDGVTEAAVRTPVMKEPCLLSNESLHCNSVNTKNTNQII